MSATPTQRRDAARGTNERHECSWLGDGGRANSKAGLREASYSAGAAGLAEVGAPQVVTGWVSAVCGGALAPENVVGGVCRTIDVEIAGDGVGDVERKVINERRMAGRGNHSDGT